MGGDNQAIAPEESCTPVRVGGWVGVSFRVGGAIVLEPVRVNLLCDNKKAYVKKVI